MKYKRSGLAILASAFFALVFGVSFLTGQNVHHGPGFSVLGIALIVGAITVLGMTAHRWAGYFCAFCVMASIKTVLMMVFGYHTLSGTLEIGTSLSEFLGLFIVLTALSYRFALRLPRSKLEIIALVGGVVGLALDALLEPNLWPLRGSTLLLTFSWVIDRMIDRPPFTT